MMLPDILAFLQKEIELIRYTLAEILKRSGRFAEFKVNPQVFTAAAAKEIPRALYAPTLEGIKYEKNAGIYWEQIHNKQEAEDGIVRYLGNPYEVQNCDKSLFNAIECESEECRTKESERIACGRKRLDALGVDYDVMLSSSEVSI
ncbi:MAG: hypothetical protein OXB98_15055 [Bryobacterales bacterium]|nr:hypothetical protein [Bryobacterales bacterium]